MKSITLFLNGTPIVHQPIAKRQIQIGTASDNDLIVASAILRECKLTVELDEDGKWQAHMVHAGDGIHQSTSVIEPGKRIGIGEYEIALSNLQAPAVNETNDDLGLIGHSKVMVQLRRQIRQLAPLRAPVLIEGESGTGKELAAKALHLCSHFAPGPFIAVNCGSITETMAEDIFFGHEKGAFTGAGTSHRGVFERAENGTLFLDELGELPLRQQAALLRVLDSRTVCRIGAEQPRMINFRLIAATNRNLQEMVEKGEFRLDLYHRISTLRLIPPPLRNRKTDIIHLAQYFLADMAGDVGFKSLGPDAIEKLRTYSWPGNCRELRNVLYKAAALGAEPLLHASDLDTGQCDASRAAGSPTDDLILLEMSHSNGNVTQAARALGIPRTTLRNRLKALGVGRPSHSASPASSELLLAATGTSLQPN